MMKMRRMSTAKERRSYREASRKKAEADQTEFDKLKVIFQRSDNNRRHNQTSYT